MRREEYEWTFAARLKEIQNGNVIEMKANPLVGKGGGGKRDV